MNSTSFPSFDLDSIRDIAELLRESELGEICLETTGENNAPARLRLKRAAPVPVAATVSVLPAESVAPAGSTPNAEAAPGEVADADATPTFEINAHAVGVFREAKIPVIAGDLIKARQVLGCVESLRVPNDIAAPSAGRLLEIVAREGQGVEFGQTLFVIEEV